MTRYVIEDMRAMCAPVAAEDTVAEWMLAAPAPRQDDCGENECPVRQQNSIHVAIVSLLALVPASAYQNESVRQKRHAVKRRRSNIVRPEKSVIINTVLFLAHAAPGPEKAYFLST